MPKARCPQCAAVVTYAAGYAPICPSCGFRGPAPAAAYVPYAPAASPALLAPQPNVVVVAQPAWVPERGFVAAPPSTGMATAALVCGAVSFLFPVAALAAVILGFVAMGQADRDPQRYGGKGMAVAGAVLGGIVGLFWIVLFGAWGFDDSPFWWDW